MSSEISSLTESQERLLAGLTIPAALASMFGSSLIIHMVLRARRTNPYKRILLGMSVADIIASAGMTIQPWLVPRATSTHALAVGNAQTCSFLGFVWQLSFATFFYNGALSTYYLLSIRYGISERVVARRIEPWMHLLSTGFPLVTAIIGVCLGIFAENELGVGCWINDYPRNCGTDQGDTGEPCLSATLAWIMGGIPVFCILILIVTNNLLIYLYVRRIIYRSARRQYRRSRFLWNTTNPSSSDNTSSHLTDAQTKRVRAVATQAALYVVAFFCTYAWPIAIRIIESMGFDAENEHQIFPFLVLMSIFSPLSGLLNLLVYLRPRYLKTRGDFPLQHRSWAVRRALFSQVVEPEEEQDQQRHAATTSNPTEVVGHDESPPVAPITTSSCAITPGSDPQKLPTEDNEHDVRDGMSEANSSSMEAAKEERREEAAVESAVLSSDTKAVDDDKEAITDDVVQGTEDSSS